MFDVSDSLRAAFDGAHRRLLEAQTDVARAAAGRGGARGADAAMAQTAASAIFTQALLGAEHARLQEIKSVAK